MYLKKQIIVTAVISSQNAAISNGKTVRHGTKSCGDAMTVSIHTGFTRN